MTEPPAFAWKIPRRWSEPGLAERPALYPALYLRWARRRVVVGRQVPPGAWNGAACRVLVTDGPLADDEREAAMMTAARGQSLVHAPLGGVEADDRAFLAGFGFATLAWTDEEPLASGPPPAGRGPLVQGCAARLAEDILLAQDLGTAAPAALPDTDGPPHAVLVIDGPDSFGQVWPAIEREARRRDLEVLVTGEDDAMLADIGAGAGLSTIGPADPMLLSRIASAETLLCACTRTPTDSFRPAQWVRTALRQGAAVVASSHPSLDGLAHLCVMDDWERGLQLYGRFPVARLEAAAKAQRVLEGRLKPDRIAEQWSRMAAPATPSVPSRAAPSPRPPLLLVLIDIHQDLDILLPVLLALRRRGGTRLRLALTDWLVADSPRVLNELTDAGFSYDVYPREQVRAGDAPLLGGVDGVLAAADTSVRAHKSGHTLLSRANDRGLPTFTIQHGLENIGLTYKDHLHGEEVRFAARTIFLWGPPEGLAPWAAPETRAAAVPVGSPKATPAPAARLDLHQGFWARTVGVFENLHWHRFSDHFRERFVADLEDAAARREDWLFLVKPHHAGRWMSRNRGLIGERTNLVVIDPTDSVWEPHTAPALIASVDLVLTTPSTVALDAARGGRPTAVFGYDLDLPLYEPLPILRSGADLERFLSGAGDHSLLDNEAFLARTLLPGRADHRIAARIAEALRGGQTARAVRARRRAQEVTVR